jgi:peptidoglycan/LPS O-acetylase OafA/YrhL
MKNKALNDLRLIAALLVLFSHSFLLSNGFDPLETIIPTLTLARVGLAIFFVLSGYLITKSFLEDSDLKRFLIKRALRIFPALIAIALLTAFLVGPLLTDLSPGEYFSSIQTYLYPVLVSLLYTFKQTLPGVLTNQEYPVNQINVSLWTLPVEFAAYLLTPLVLMIFKKRSTLLLLLLLLFLMAYSVSIFQYFDVWFIQIAWLWAAFFLGSVFYLKNMTLNYFYQIALLILILASVIFPVLVPATTILFALILLDIALKYGSNKESIKVDLSYGIYIISFPVQQLVVFFIDPGPIILFLISLLIVAPLAYLSWNLIEKRALRLKPRID